VNQEIETVSTVIKQGGGEVLEIQNWGRRRLAYEMRKKREGIYSLIRFKSGGAVLEDLARRFKLNESLMRHLTVLSEGPMAPPATDDHGLSERREGHGRHGYREHGRFDDRRGGGSRGADRGSDWGAHADEVDGAGHRPADRPDTGIACGEVRRRRARGRSRPVVLRSRRLPASGQRRNIEKLSDC
jgi:small subunit ribosomal protein S6